LDIAHRGWYARSPLLFQNMAVAAAGIVSKVVRGGTEYRRLLHEYEGNQWRTAREYKDAQDSELRRLIRHCYEHVPFYQKVMRERALTPKDFGGIEDLPKLPFLTKDIVRAHGPELLRSDRGAFGTVRAFTSGSTGKPLTLVRDMRCVIAEQAAIRRHWHLAGFPVGGRRVTLRGDATVPMGQTRPPYWRHNPAEKQIFMSSFHLSRATVPHYVSALQRFQPDALQAYPSSAYFLAKTMLELDLKVVIPFIFTGSEPVYPRQRAVIEEAFSGKLFDLYGCAERVVLAMECREHSGRHNIPENGIIELVEPEGPHAEGMYEIVGTGLTNYAMPLLRYRTGDLTDPLVMECACGRSMPKILRVEKREGDMIVTPDGRHLAFSGLTHAFMGLKGIERSQIIQDAMDHVTVRIVPAGDYADGDGTKAVTRLSEYFGEGLRIDLELVDGIECEPSGKYRWIVSRINPADWE